MTILCTQKFLPSIIKNYEGCNYFIQKVSIVEKKKIMVILHVYDI